MSPDEAIADAARYAMTILEEYRTKPHSPDARVRLHLLLSTNVEHLAEHLGGECTEACAYETARTVAAEALLLFALAPEAESRKPEEPAPH